MMSSPLCADTVVYWRFEDGITSETQAESFAAEISPTAQFEDDVPGDLILVDGAERANRQSYSNGTSEEGTQFASSLLLDETLSRNSFTIEGFLKLGERGGLDRHMRILGNAYYLGKPGGWSVGVDEGQLVFNALQALTSETSSAQTLLVATKKFEEQKWHHFAIVGYRSAEVLVVRLFVDGEEVEVEARSNFYPRQRGEEAIAPTENPLLLSAKNIFRGALDEIRVSDQALDPSEFLRIKP